MNLKNYNVLIVEDEFIAFEYLKNILLSLNFKKIFHANSAIEALETIKENQIDFALMDINIEGSFDGIECAKLINKEYFIPIIYTTAYGDSHTINDANESNVFGYLVKPFSLHDVEATVKVALKVISVFNTKEGDLPKQSSESEFIELKNEYRYYFKTKTLSIHGIPVDLTKKELALLDIFCQNINQNISYDTLREYVWFSKDVSASTIRDAISRLKNKVQNLDIENVINYGYILKKV